MDVVPHHFCSSLAVPPTNAPSFLFDDAAVYWQMSRWEKYSIYALLNKIRPDIAIEIGTCGGGSLSLLSAFSKTVISIDINPVSQEAISKKFNNVEFMVGDSKKLLPKILRRVSIGRDRLGFVLIDGDHSREGVLSDIENLLDFTPNENLYILLHDSFNPECRAGILDANWSRNKHVVYMDVDFVPGTFHEVPGDSAQAGTMWGGFACVLMSKAQRTGELKIRQSQQAMYDAIARISIHYGASRSIADGA